MTYIDPDFSDIDTLPDRDDTANLSERLDELADAIRTTAPAEGERPA
ncbi:hypothetical protein [Mycobacteroides chelonae]|nr:hypothetical protein [Mycobacteroides chelonae]